MFVTSKCFLVTITTFSMQIIILAITVDQEGSDTALQNDLKSWVATANNEDINKLTKVILGAVIFVAEHLVQQNATLLRTVSHIFLMRYCDAQLASSIKSVDLILELREGNVNFSSHWPLNQVILYSNLYMPYKCIATYEVWHHTVP